MKNIVLTLLAISVVLIPFTFRFFSVRSLECYTQYGNCPEYLSAKFTTLLPTSLLKPLPSKEVSHIVSRIPFVKSYRLYRRLPSTLVVILELSQPVAKISYDSKVLGVSDDRGRIFPQNPQVEVPTLELSTTPPSTKLSAQQLQAVVVLQKLSYMYKKPLTGSLHEHYLTISTRQAKPIIIIDVTQNVSVWSTSLQLILERSKISTVPSLIDLRFTQPVVKYD